jgi:hypothetical protein
MTDITVETDIPLPEEKRNPHGRWIRLSKTIQIGQSFVVKKQSEVLAARMAFARVGKGAVSRTQEDGSIRVWCIKKEKGN